MNGINVSVDGIYLVCAHVEGMDFLDPFNIILRVVGGVDYSGNENYHMVTGSSAYSNNVGGHVLGLSTAFEIPVKAHHGVYAEIEGDHPDLSALHVELSLDWRAPCSTFPHPGSG